MLDIFYLERTAKKASVKELPRLKNKSLWVDATNITQDEANILKDVFQLHPLTAEDLFNNGVRIKIEEFPNYLLCVFYALQRAKEVELVEMDFVVGKSFVLTSHRKEIASFTGLKKDLQKMTRLLKKGPGFLFHRLLDVEVDNYFPVLEHLEDSIESLEERVAKKPRPDLLSRILKSKRRIISIRRLVLQQREKLSFLAKNEYSLIPRGAIPYFRDVYDHYVRVSDSLEGLREAVANAFDVYMSTLSNNMNEVMKVLSIIATIALPLTVISGIYGTNFQMLPGSSFIYGFWTMILLMILLALGMVYFFKRRGWF